MHDLTDRALGKYIILEEIGRGGMGAVYKARDIELDRIVAMKVLSPYLVGEPRLVQRFIREARLAANLDHPNIVTIYDIGGEGGYYYFTMKYLQGQSLKEILAERGPLPLIEVVPIVQQLASALDYAHEQNLIHRDIKPGNVIVDDSGQITLTDFGLAKVAENLKLAASGEAIGTLEYMAPEQARGEVEKRSDIYSLAVMTYQMLTSRLPFQGENQASLLYQHLHEPPPPMREWCPYVPPEVEQSVLKAMAKDPADRHETAGDLARELEQAARKAVLPAPARRRPPKREQEGLLRPARAKPKRARRPIFPPALVSRLSSALPFLRRWGWVVLAVVVLVPALLFGGPALYRAVKRPTATPTPVATAAPTLVPVPTQREPAKVHYFPLVSKFPPGLPGGGQAQLALLCTPEEAGGMEYLAFWEWGQDEPIPWPGLPENPVTSQLSWSADGDWLVFVLAEEGRSNLYRILRDGSELQRLTGTSTGKEDPVWSPDDRQIAYALGPQGNRGIFLLSVEGGEPRNLTPGNTDDWAPSWAPDSRRLAFVSNRDGNTEIYVLDLVTDQLQRLTDHPGQDVYPAWSPDGERITFLSDRSGEFRLYVMDAEGAEVHLLFDGDVLLERSAWSPQGDWLAFTHQAEGDLPQVHLLNLDSGELYTGPAGCRRPAWRPGP